MFSETLSLQCLRSTHLGRKADVLCGKVPGDTGLLSFAYPVEWMHLLVCREVHLRRQQTAHRAGRQLGFGWVVNVHNRVGRSQ